MPSLPHIITESDAPMFVIGCSSRKYPRIEVECAKGRLYATLHSGQTDTSSTDFKATGCSLAFGHHGGRSDQMQTEHEAYEVHVHDSSVLCV